MMNVVIVLILLFILGGASYYIYRSKKRGVKCIGCPYAGQCHGGCEKDKKE